MRRALAAAVSLLVLIAAGCGGGSSDEGSAPAGPAREPFLGVTTGALLASPSLLTREIPVMARSGVTSVRVPFYWSRLEPEKGRPALASSDRLVAAAARSRLDVLPIVVGTPTWAKSNRYDPAAPPRDLEDYAAFLRALIARYGPDGSLWREQPDLPRVPIRAWQIWNEPSHDYYWSTQPWPRSYVRLLRASHDAVRKADPGAKTVLAGFPDRSWESLRMVEQAGGEKAFDVAATHPYTARVANVLKIVKLDRAALRAAGDGDKPLWLTEVSWSSGQGKVLPRYRFGFETTEQGQAARLAQALPLLAAKRRSLGIERMYWESWATRDRNAQSTWDWAGLRELDGTTLRPKPAFAAFVRVARRLQRAG
jgi:hypothetical protein